MRSIKEKHSAAYAPIADLITYTALPTPRIKQIDPFLFLNHHGHQVYAPNNNGLPFGPHPHRGMETVTFILKGDIMHKDSGGHESVITAGGVQWMTAGSGLIHAEVSSNSFKKSGGELEILQLWLNLPSRLKMSPPNYRGLQSDEIPVVYEDNERVKIALVAGDWYGKSAAFKPQLDVHLNTIHFKPDGALAINVPTEHNIFFYVVNGSLDVNGQFIEARNLVEFKNDQTGLRIRALEESVLLFGHSKPLQEPVVAQGPFVMNTTQEIHQAYEDYRQGKFGSWEG